MPERDVKQILGFFQVPYDSGSEDGEVDLNECDLEIDPAFLKELERRAEEMRTGPSVCIPWEIVREMR